MAKKEEPKNVLERVYVIPLRRQTLKVPFYRKSKKAITTIREFVSKHMKTDEVSIGKYLNLEVWKHGIKNPPGKVKVNVTKDDKGKTVVEIFGAPKEEKKKKDDKKPEEKSKEEKKEEKIEEKKVEEKKEKDKEEIKELKKEHPKQQTPKQPVQKQPVQKQPTAPKSV